MEGNSAMDYMNKWNRTSNDILNARMKQYFRSYNSPIVWAKPFNSSQLLRTKTMPETIDGQFRLARTQWKMIIKLMI